MMPRQSLKLRAMILAWTVWLLTSPAIPLRASSLSLEAISEATGTFHPLPAPGTATLSLGPSTMLLVSLDGRVPSSVETALEFDLGSVPQGATITSATLWLSIAGTQSSLGLPALTVTGFGSDIGAVQLANFDGGPYIGGITSNALPANSGPPGSLNMLFGLNATPFVQSLVDANTNYAGFVLDDPNISNLLVWGSSASDPAERPSLALSFSVPEPSSVLLMSAGLAGLAAFAWHRVRQRREFSMSRFRRTVLDALAARSLSPFSESASGLSQHD